MNMFSHLWQYLTDLFLELEMFQIKVVEKIKTPFIFSDFLRKLYHLWDNVEEYGGARGATNDVTVWRIRIACLISKATGTHTHARAHAPGHPDARTLTHRQIRNFMVFSMVTIVTRTHFVFTLCVRCLYCLLIWEQTAINSLYSINWLLCMTETESVYCAVRAESI
jgi:hypothetical protein